MSDIRPDGGAPEIVDEQSASQGRKGWGVRRVLAISLVLIVVVFGIIYAINAPGLSTHHGAGGQSGVVSHADANSFHAPEPAPKPAPANGVAGEANQPTPH